MKTMNDIYLLISGKQYDCSNKEYILYIPRSFYSNPDNVEIIEEIAYINDNLPPLINRFFLNENGIYPINIAGPAVSKVIPWNLKEAKKNSKNNPLISDLSKFEPGYFIDLRQLKMSRLNMIKTEDEHIITSAECIPNKLLPCVKSGFLKVPSDDLASLRDIPIANLYVAFFDEINKTHNNINCYNYKVCYISLETIRENIDNYDENKISIWEVNDKIPDEDEQISHLETYYGDAGIQAGALNPFDIQADKDFHFNSSTTHHNDMIMLGGPRGGGGATCYVANLRTFKK
ncbi:hypothetical protein MSP8887_03766 [Marinomonas spartinae]|uniref:hypothetical protein n=1 Tax=Marinomonas spartinae TaxID=1792290 RepID=UPI000809039C|nr:hypothetical protein [Marinomonas spartinae]SBS39329.1 hypothetical protein MSP8887_03766 [Marinomonas spartinae]